MPLRDRLCKPGVRVLFVGINPGIRSAETGHHFAGYSNRFWKLLFDPSSCPKPIDWRDDDRLPEWGFGITNLVARATPGIDTLSREECVAGIELLRAKGAPLQARDRRVRRRVAVSMDIRRQRRRHGSALSARRSKAPRSSCCRTRAAETRISRTPKCWRHFESSDVDLQGSRMLD